MRCIMEEENEMNDLDNRQDDKNSTTKSLGVFTKLKNGAKNLGDRIFNKIETHSEAKSLVALFESQSSSFLYWDNNKSYIIYGIRNIPEHSILFLLRDKNKIHGNMELSTNGQQLIIQEFDYKQIVPYTCKSTSISLDCFTAFYKIKEQQPLSTRITQTNNITVGDNFHGDINAVNQAKTETLDKIENLLKNSKPKLFHKTQYQEANDMFIAFKGAITKNEKPKQSFIDQFVKLLKIIAPAAVSLVLGLI